MWLVTFDGNDLDAGTPIEHGAIHTHNSTYRFSFSRFSFDCSIFMHFSTLTNIMSSLEHSQLENALNCYGGELTHRKKSINS